MSPDQGPEAVEAVEAALAEGRFADAVRSAQALLPRVDGEERLRTALVLQLGRVRCGDAEPADAEALEAQARGTPWHGAARLALGQTLLFVGRLEEAHQVLSACVADADSPDARLAWRAKGYLGLIRRHRHDLEGAERLLREAATALEALGDRCEAAARWSSLAETLRWMSRFEAAHEAYERSHVCAQGFPIVLAETLRSHAALHGQRGEMDKAHALLTRAMPLLEGRVTLTRSRILSDLGEIARHQGRLDEARDLLQQALAARYDGETAIVELNLALVELDRGDRAQARALAASAIAAATVPWYRTFGHAVGLAASDDEADFDLHLAALEASAVHALYLERDLLYLYALTTSGWASRDPDRAARTALLQHGQAVGLRADVASVEATLVALRARGAALPLGPLDLEAEVRSGGMGQVWRGVVRGTPLAVAVKVLAAERAGDAHIVEALSRELRAVARLDHPHIVPIVDHGLVGRPITAMTGGRLVEGTPWLATRWAAHGTLEAWCGRRRFEHLRAALLQLLDALAAAHADGLLHLDVKPANVLVASEHPLTLWLADFGIARALGADARGTVSGSPSFMSPEQCRGASRQYGPWTDLYAVGATAVALAQGRPPFEGTGREQMQQQVSRPLPPLQPAVPVPEGFEGWCRRLMEKAPEHRFHCAADAAAALVALGDAPEGEVRPVLAAQSGTSSTFILDAMPASPAAVGAAPEGPPAPAPMPARPPPGRVRVTVPELAWAAHRLLPLRRVPMVGRAEERALLWSALRAVEDGPAAVRLSATGAGRTRLLGWLAEVATRSGAARVLWVDHATGDPFRAALASLLRVEGLGPDALELALPRQLDLHVGPDALTPGEQRLLLQLLGRSFDGAPPDPIALALRLVRAMARERRVLVCLPIADPGCATFVERLLRAPHDLPVLAVGLAEALPDVEGAQTVHLAALDDADIAELIDALVPLDPAVRDRLVAVARGEPATAVWTVRDWLADRKLVASPDGLRLDEHSTLPASPEEAVQRLLEPVLAESRARRRQLALAALLGRHVDGDAWRRACEADGARFDPAMADGLVTRGLLQEDATGYRFSEGRVRALILDRIPTRDLPDLRRAAATSP